MKTKIIRHVVVVFLLIATIIAFTLIELFGCWISFFFSYLITITFIWVMHKIRKGTALQKRKKGWFIDVLLAQGVFVSGLVFVAAFLWFAANDSATPLLWLLAIYFWMMSFKQLYSNNQKYWSS